MERKILSLAMALCMIALVFTALPAKGEVFYTGAVQTMDDTGMLKDTYFRGERVYVNVTLWYQNALVDADIYLELYDQYGDDVSTIGTFETNDPAVGYYNSSTAGTSLSTNNVEVDGDVAVCEVALFALSTYGWIEVVREQILVREERVSLDPDPSTPYFPGQPFTITVLTVSDDEFFVEILDPDGHEMVLAKTGQEADENGLWSWTLNVSDDASDGWYTVNVISEVTDDYLWSDWWSTSVAYFEVGKYRLEMYSDRSIVLPGETVEVEYIVYDQSTLSLYTDVTTEWTATWVDLAGDEQMETGELVPAYEGTESFTIPADINMSSDYDIHFWVNDTDDRTSERELTFSIGNLNADVWTDQGEYMAGMVVTVEVDAWVEYDWYDHYYWDALPGADVDIVVEKDGSAIAEYGLTGMTTGVYGEVEHDFTLAQDAALGTYLVTATISKLDYSVVRMTTFEVGFDYWFEVELDKDSYYSGETATAKFTTMWGVQEVTDNTVFFIVYSSVGDLYSNTTNMGEAEFTIPADFVGTLSIYAVTAVEGYTMDDSDWATVSKAYISLAPLVEEYTAGDTVQWEYVLMTAMADGQLSYEIWSSDGEMVASTEIMFSVSGSITYTVPAQEPASWYALVLTLKDGMGNSVSSTSYVYLVSMYEISAWIDNDSGFVGGAFEPGDKIRIGYEITTNGAAHRSVYKIEYYTSADWISLYVITTSTTGTIELTVPEGTADGDYSIYVDLLDGVTNAYLAGDWMQYDVVAGQSGWDKEVAGMSAIDFTILVLIVVMIVLLIVVPFLKGKEFKLFKPKEPAPAPAPSVEPPPAPPTQ